MYINGVITDLIRLCWATAEVAKPAAASRMDTLRVSVLVVPWIGGVFILLINCQRNCRSLGKLEAQPTW